MSDATHMLVYRRFFAVLFSVLPGLNMIVGLSALLLWLLADVVGMEWGWGVGLAAILFAILFVVWIVVGLGVQKWAEEKSTGLLFGLNAPFIVVDLGLLLWLFVEVVIGSGEEEGASEAARMLVETLQLLA